MSKASTGQGTCDHFALADFDAVIYSESDCKPTKQNPTRLKEPDPLEYILLVFQFSDTLEEPPQPFTTHIILEELFGARAAKICTMCTTSLRRI